MKIRRCVLSIVLLVLATEAVLAQGLQRMRLPAGVHAIPSRGGRVTAICLDGPNRPAPASTDLYSAASNSITVTRVAPTGNQTLPYAEATRKWIDVRGDESATSLIVTPKKFEPAVTYKMNVAAGGRGVVGQDAGEVADILGKLGTKTEGLDKLDEFTHKLESAVGNDSPISEFVRGLKYQFESRIAVSDAGRVSRETQGIVPRMRRALADPDSSPGERLETLTVVHGKLLTDAQINALRELELTVATEYDAQFRSSVQELETVQTRLREAFGPQSSFERDFAEDVRYRFLQDRDLAAAIEESRSEGEAFPSELRDLDGRRGARDALSLFLGRPITDAQSATLREVFNWDGGESTGELSRHLYLTEDLDGNIEFRTTETTTKAGPGGLPRAARRMLKTHPHIVVDTMPSPEILRALHKEGIYFVRRFDRVLHTPIEPARKVRLIFAVADDAATNDVLFEGQNSAAVGRAAATAAGIAKEKRILVKSKAEFIAALDGMKADERAVFVFHGTEEIHFPDGAVRIEDYLDRCDPLSCDTWKLDFFGDLVSTGKIDIEVVARAAKSAIDASPTVGFSGAGGVPPGGPGNGGGESGGPNAGGDFYRAYINAYRSEGKAEGGKEKYIKMLLLGAAGATVALVKWSDDDDDEDEDQTEAETDKPKNDRNMGAKEPKRTPPQNREKQ